MKVKEEEEEEEEEEEDEGGPWDDRKTTSQVELPSRPSLLFSSLRQSSVDDS